MKYDRDEIKFIQGEFRWSIKWELSEYIKRIEDTGSLKNLEEILRDLLVQIYYHLDDMSDAEEVTIENYGGD